MSSHSNATLRRRRRTRRSPLIPLTLIFRPIRLAAKREMISGLILESGRSASSEDSSEEIVGECRFGQFTKNVIEREFGDAEGAKTVRFSHSDFDFVVEALDHAAGELLFGLEVVKNQLAVGAEHVGDFLHGLDARAQGVLAPNVEV